MRKLLALLLAAVMLFSLAACGKEPDTDQKEPNQTAPSSSVGTNDQSQALYEAVNQLVQCTVMGDTANLEKLAPEAFWLFYENAGTPRSTLLTGAKYAAEAGNQYFKGVLGESITSEFILLGKKDVDAADLAKIAASMAEQKGIPADQVTAACNLTLDVVVNGTAQIVQSMEITAFQIDGNWYCGSYHTDNDRAYVSFEIEGMIGG